MSAGRLVARDAATGAAADAVIAGSPFALLELFARREDSAAPRSRASGCRSPAMRKSPPATASCSGSRGPTGRRSCRASIGDLPARTALARGARGARRGRADSRAPQAENVAEYLQEESRDLVSRPEVEEFLAKVDELRETADRVEARLARLERRLEGSA